MKKPCSLCNEIHPSEELVQFHDSLLCPDCLAQHTLIYDHCEERIYRQDNAGSGYQPLCQSCYDNCYTQCADCGAIIHHDTCYTDNDINALKVVGGLHDVVHIHNLVVTTDGVGFKDIPCLIVGQNGERQTILGLPVQALTQTNLSAKCVNFCEMLNPLR